MENLNTKLEDMGGGILNLLQDGSYIAQPFPTKTEKIKFSYNSIQMRGNGGKYNFEQSFSDDSGRAIHVGW